MSSLDSFYLTISNIGIQDSVLEMFFVLKNTNIKKACLDNEASERLLEEFLNVLKKKINEDTTYKPIEELDDTNVENEYLYFNNDNLYEKLSYLLCDLDSENITYANNIEENIFGLLFRIKFNDDHILLYQQCYPMSFTKKAIFFSLFSDGATFKEIKQDRINIPYRIDFLINKQFFIILNSSPLEKEYGYKNIIMQKATQIISAINFVSNIDFIYNNLDSTNAKKLKNADETIIEMLENNFDEVKKFIENHSELKTLKFEGSKINVNSKKDMKLLIKFLSHNYLHSQLTKENFDSSSKKKLKQ